MTRKEEILKLLNGESQATQSVDTAPSVSVGGINRKDEVLHLLETGKPMDANYFTTELGKIPDFIKQSSSDFKNYGYSSSDDVYNGIVSGVDNYKRTIENAKKYNPQWYEKNKVDIDNVVKALDDVYNSYAQKRDVYKQFSTEQDFNDAVKYNFYSTAADIDHAINDIKSQKATIQSELDTINANKKAGLVAGSIWESQNGAKINELEKKLQQLDEKETSFTNAKSELKRNQNLRDRYNKKLSFGGVQNVPEFAEYSEKGSKDYTVDVSGSIYDIAQSYNSERNKDGFNNQNKLALFWAITDKYPELLKDGVSIYDIEGVRFNGGEHLDYFITQLKNGMTVGLKDEQGNITESVDIQVSQMDDTQRKIYNYLFAMNGAEVADEYLAVSGEELSKRKGEAEVEALEGKPLKQIWYGFTQAPKQWEQDFLQSMSGLNAQYPVSHPSVYGSQKIKEDETLGGFGRFVFDVAQTSGYQLPAQAVSLLVGGFAGDKASAITNGLMMGMGAAGGAYTEAVNMGYDTDQARSYAIMVGAAETALEAFSDGATKAGGLITGNALKKATSGIKSGIGKFAVKLPGKMLSEATEEYLAEVLDTAWKNIAFDRADDLEWLSGDAFYAALLGAVSAVGMGSISSVSDIRFETARDQIIDAGLSLAHDTEAYKLASSLESKKYKLEPKQLQDLSNKIQETTAKMYEAKIEQNRKWYKQIRNELVSLGETGDVSAIASAIVRLKNNDAITVNDLKLIADSKLAADYGFNPSENTTTQTEDTQNEVNSVLPRVSAAANDAENGILKPNSGVVETESSGSVFSSPETEQNNSPKNVNSVNNTSNGGSDVEQDADVDSDKYAKDKSFWQAENENKDAKISKTLREKLASLFGKKNTDKPVSIGEIVKLIEKEFGVPISSGRFRHNAYGIYKNKARAIRTKITNALPTIAHELGHHLDRIYNLHSLPSISEAMEVLKTDRPDFYSSYKASSQPKEAVAEFLRIYLSDRTLAQNKYPKFFKEFEATLNKSDLKNIQEIGDLINKYYTAAKSEAARSAVLTRTEARRIDRLGIRLADLFERVITNLVDKARPIKKISKMAYDRFTYALKTTVRAKNSISGYYLSGLDGKPLNLKGDEYKSITDEEGNVLAFRYLFDKLQSNEQINDFRMYLVYKHAVEWLKQDKRVFADDAINNIDFVTQQIAELEAANPIFKETAERVYLWQRVFMQEYAVKSGLVKAETLDKLNQTYPCYIPFYRHVEKGGGGAKTSVANQKSLIKRAKGSGLELYDPFENIIVMVDRWMKAADRNAVMQEIAKTADTEEGLGYLLEKVDLKQMPNSVRTEIARNSFEGAMKDYLAEQGTDAKSTDNITKAILEVFDESVGESITEFKVLEFQGKSFATVMRNGKMEVYQIHDKNLLESVMGLSEANVGNILKVLGTLTRMMKALTTGVNAIWALTSNSIRDIQSAFMYSSNNNPASFTLDYIKAVGMVLKENFTNKTTETMKLYKTAGGGFNNSLSSDLKTIRATVNDIAGKPTFMERLKKLLNILNHIENISDAIETAPRLAEFMRTYDKTKDAKKAILAAEEITVNFNRSGSFGKSVDQVIPYFNASVQGLNKLVTTLKDENGNRRAFIAKVISSAVITTLLQVAFMHIGGDDGEEEYAKLSSYKKNNFYNFYIGDGKFISISKPKELGLMASFMERTVEITTNEDADAKHEIEEYSAYAFDMLIPPLLDEAIVFGTIADIRANEDYKGTPIVSSYYESLLPEDQYNEKTSYLARILGDWFGYSPMKIDYIINSNLGVIGTLNQAFFSPEGDLTGGIKNKFYTDNAYSTDTFNKFYENAEKAAQTAASNPNDAEAIYRNKQYNSVKSVVSALNQYGKDLGLEREYKIYAQQYVADFEKNDQIDKRIVRLLNRTGDKDILYDKSFSATYSIDGVKHTIPAEQYLDYIDEYYAEIEKAYDEILRYGYSDERTVAMLKQAKSDVEKKLKKKYKTGE